MRIWWEDSVSVLFNFQPISQLFVSFADLWSQLSVKKRVISNWWLKLWPHVSYSWFSGDVKSLCGNSYGRLIRRKGLIPFVSISLFFCRSNWLTEVDLSNRKTAFHKLSTFRAASVRPRASSYRFFAPSALSAFAAIIFLAKLKCEHPIYVVLIPVRS